MATPHDSLFKQVFSAPRRAAAALRQVLPAEVAAQIRWGTLQRVPGSFVDAGMADQHVDVLFEARIGRSAALLHVILEHKSVSDRWTAWQVLRYAVRVLEDHLRRHPGAVALPLVFPVVVHHSQRGWQHATDVAELFAVDEELRPTVAPWLLRFPFLLDDLSRQNEASLARRADSAAMLLALVCLQRLRHATDPAWELGRLRRLFRDARASPESGSLLIAVLSYLARVWELDPVELRSIVHAQLGSEIEDAMSSTYDQLVNQGREQGLEQGRDEGRAELLLDLLAARFGPLSADVEQRVREARDVEHRSWARRVLTAGSLEEVLTAD